MKVVIMESLGISEEELEERKKPLEEKGCEFVSYPKTTDIETLKEEAKDADAMIIANMPMPGEVISACEHLKFLDVAFTGVDHVGLDACRRKKVAVSNASGYSNEAVAELVIGMTLSLMRNLPQVEKRVREGGTKMAWWAAEIKRKDSRYHRSGKYRYTLCGAVSCLRRKRACSEPHKACGCAGVCGAGFPGGASQGV